MTDERYAAHFEPGMYRCSRCNAMLFPSTAKFKSHTIWPSFREAIPGAITTKSDDSLGMERTEILCAKCGLHLGHVFDDGQFSGDTHPEAKRRFCVLSETLKFTNRDEKGGMSDRTKTRTTRRRG